MCHVYFLSRFFELFGVWLLKLLVISEILLYIVAQKVFAVVKRAYQKSSHKLAIEYNRLVVQKIKSIKKYFVMARFGSKDQLATLEKLQPVDLPVNTLGDGHELYQVRKSFAYVYVVNWIYRFRGYLRLASEYFDVELFEMELLSLFNPPPLDESVLFINKLKLQLINALTNSGPNSAKFQINDFDLVIKKLFVNTSLGDLESSQKFDLLPLQEKFELLYTILDYLSSLNNFRVFLDKSNFPHADLNFKVLKSDFQKNQRQDLLLAFNESKIIKRTIEFPSLIIPKKRIDCPEDPDDFFWDKFDIDLNHVTFDIECWTLLDYNNFLKANQRKPFIKPLMSPDFQSNVLTIEIKKRRIIQNRKKEYQLLNLMATRKKSSRLEAKERQKQLELEDEKLRKQNELKLALELDKVSKPLKYNTNTLSREDRLKLRKLNHASSTPTQSETTNEQKSNNSENKSELEEEFPKPESEANGELESQPSQEFDAVSEIKKDESAIHIPDNGLQVNGDQPESFESTEPHPEQIELSSKSPQIYTNI